MSVRQECTCEESCARCSIELTIAAKATANHRGTLEVTSKDMVRSARASGGGADMYEEVVDVPPRSANFGQPVGQGECVLQSAHRGMRVSAPSSPAREGPARPSDGKVDRLS